jgi:F-type H+-transporting ATPase subunit beta
MGGDRLSDLSDRVIAAQRGDKAAFSEIVRRFQDMAYGVAYAILGDAAVAQDVAQEAFIEAYVNLPALREPAAFPGWFRRIVLKYSDRELRGRRPMVSFDDTLGLTIEGADPDGAIELLERRQTVQDAIAELAPAQREVVTLFYLRDYSQKEIEDFLELPVSTIKKHLFTARKKLKGRLDAMVEKQIQSHRPSQTDAFANEVRRLLALRTGDLESFKALIEQHPELLENRFEIRPTRERHYWPTGGTALHWAVVSGDEALLAFLRSHNADMNPKDRYGMTPLHTAVWMRQQSVLAQLLAAGADADATTEEDHTALHLAAMRNSGEAARVLLEAGARADARDKSGRTAMDWATINRAESVIKRLIAGGGEPTQIAASTGKSAPGTESFLETGIKAIDLFAPLARGGENGFLTPHTGVGCLVVLGEVIHRMDAVYGGRTVCLGFDDEHFTGRDMQLLLQEVGVTDVATVCFAATDDGVEQRLETVREALRQIDKVRGGDREVLLVAQTRIRLFAAGAAEIDTKLSQQAGLTVIYWGEETVGAEPEPLTHLDAAVTFDVSRAKQQLYPAIDLIRSGSRLLADESGDEQHREIATRVRRVLTRYQDLRPMIEARGIDLLPTLEDRIIVERARRLDRFMTQPFHWTCPWTGMPGEHVPLGETLEGCRAILDGECDEMPEESFFFVGNLKSAREKAKRALAAAKRSAL